MKKYLLPQDGTFYKANLHCHSTVSDGDWTPEEIKTKYMQMGYSIVAYTDHNVFVPQNNLTDEYFLALNGLEYNVDEDPLLPKNKKTCHFCFIALSPDTIIQPCWHREKYHNTGLERRSSHLVIFDKSKPDYERTYDAECISNMMNIGRSNGFFVTYNHPVWSEEGYSQYIHYKGMHAMEICNYCSVAAGYDDHNSKEYDEMLRAGKHIYCVATDDNHNHNGDNDSFGGFTMIKAINLNYTSVTDALIKGQFYASEGPLIHELWYEDGKVHITFDPAKEVRITKGIRGATNRIAKDGSPLTKACFDIAADDIYFRITVKNNEGKCAYTNAYFVDEL